MPFLAFDLRSHPPRALLIAIALLLAACASTSLTNSWTDATYKGPKLKKLMVMGVSSCRRPAFSSSNTR